MAVRAIAARPGDADWVISARGKGPGMTTYDVTWADERGRQSLEADDVVLEDGIYEFWRYDDVFLRAPADQVREITPQAEQ